MNEFFLILAPIGTFLALHLGIAIWVLSRLNAKVNNISQTLEKLESDFKRFADTITQMQVKNAEIDLLKQQLEDLRGRLSRLEDGRMGGKESRR